ncbi:MAG TPA: type II secretion system F family protein [bacterium]|nr:type II secretion system F family protein [bacterium]
MEKKEKKDPEPKPDQPQVEKKDPEPKLDEPQVEKKEEKKKPNKKATLKKLNFFSRIGTGEERDYFIENLAMLVSSGMDILLAIDAIKAGVKTPQIREILDYLKSRIDGGSPIWKALKETELLPDHMLSLVRIGEETGRLTENLKVIVIQQEKERSFNAKLRSALMYPLFVLILTLGLGIGIAWFILPKLSTVFDSLDLELPLVTRVLIGFGNFLSEYGIIVVPIFLAVLFATLYFIFLFPKTKHIGQIILFNTPVIKMLIRQTELGRMGYILGTLLDAGLPIVTATNSLRDSTSFISYVKFYDFLSGHIEAGGTFQKAFINYGKTKKLLPIPVQQMIIAAEKSGTLSKTLLNIGRIYEGKTEITTKNLTILLEPIMLIIVWGGVVTVAIAVILPIYSLVGQFN